jgi:hypothetical protein
MTLNNSMSITPSLPGHANGAKFEHGSVLGGKTRAARVSSQWKSTKSHFLRLGQNRRLSGSLRRHAPLLLTRIARVDSLVSQLIRDLEGELKLAVRQVTVCLDDR